MPAGNLAGECKKCIYRATNVKTPLWMEKIFVSYINDHRGLLFKICNLYCSDAEDRKDLFQEMVLQLWKAFPTFRGASSPSTWMYRVALNTAISNYRKSLRRPQKQEQDQQLFEVPDINTLPMQVENQQMLYAAIEKLNDLEKAVILLYLDEKSYAEIAEILGITISNVGVRINRIKNKLSQQLKNDLYES